MDIIVKPILNDLSSYIKQKITNFLLPIKDFSVEYTNYYTIEEIKKLKNDNINILEMNNKTIENNKLIIMDVTP